MWEPNGASERRISNSRPPEIARRSHQERSAAASSILLWPRRAPQGTHPGGAFSLEFSSQELSAARSGALRCGLGALCRLLSDLDRSHCRLADLLEVVLVGLRFR